MMPSHHLARVSVAAALAATLTARAVGADDGEGAFRTPDNAIYCQFTTVHHVWTEFTCFRPSDGRYARLSSADLTDRTRPSATVGVDPRYVGFGNPGLTALRVGREWVSSDAALVTCRAQRNGVRCRHWLGPGFFVGRRTGERTF